MKIYLYVKQHRITGLKYFGKTTKNPYVYKGSGVHWTRHLKMHGEDIDTLEVWEFTDLNECKIFALDFSKKHNIVESIEWANMIPEDGIGGGNGGMKKENNPNWGKSGYQTSFYNKKHKPETIELYRQQKSGSNNPRAKKVITPYGTFGCISDAAKAENTNRNKITFKINQGENGYRWL